ncbi:MAG: stage III sporulation protein AA [Clostridia bacterium]|nr:stage III sporulation protein AA [Clostridia bacterium]
MTWEETRDFLSPFFPEQVQRELELMQPGELREIRIRADRPTVMRTATRVASLDWQPDQHQLEALAEALSGHSLYARTEETGQGYLTLQGGHRMGLCGRVVFTGDQPVLADIGSLCIRIAAQWPGAADALIPLLHRNGRPASALIIGVPGSGKTSLLRDISRQLSGSGKAVQTAVIDERGELAACVRGVPQLDVGRSADVLDGMPKAQAVPWLIRAMSPQLIVTDELSGSEDAACVLDAMACGAAVCASVHGGSLKEVAARPALAALMARRAFDCYAVLAEEGGGQIDAVYDRNGSPVEST